MNVKGNYHEPATPDGSTRYAAVKLGEFPLEQLLTEEETWSPYPTAKNLPAILVSPFGDVAICFKSDDDGRDLWRVMAQQKMSWPPLEIGGEPASGKRGYLGVAARLNPATPRTSTLVSVHELVGMLYVPRTLAQIEWDYYLGRYVDRDMLQYDHLDRNTWNNYFLNLERTTGAENRLRRTDQTNQIQAIQRNMNYHQQGRWPDDYRTLDEWSILVDNSLIFDPVSGKTLPDTS